MMGSRIFLNHILADDIRKQSRSILHASDVTCTRDFVQCTSHVDELPAYLGGRENTWRSLSLKELPQRDAVANGHQQKRLSPPCRDGWQHLRLQRSPVTPPCSVVSTERSDLNPTPLLPTGPSTRKCNTAHRVRQLHLLRNKLREADNGDRQRGGGCQEKACIGGLKESVSTRLAVPLVEEKGFNDVAFSEWEEEADKLYIWTQQLDISDIDTAPYPEK